MEEDDQWKREKLERMEEGLLLAPLQIAESREWLEWLVGGVFRIEVVPINGTYEVLSLIDLLETEIMEQRSLGVRDPKGFWNNRALIWQAFTEERLFVLQIEPHDVAWEDHGFWDDLYKIGGLFLRHSSRVLPCFCTIDSLEDPRIELIWTWRPLRRLGLARRFVEEFGIREVNQALIDSKPFWNACAVKINSYA